MITVKNASRRYGDFVAVDNISFSIDHGEIVGLLGHNGAGKTTIMKMLTGFLEPSSGQIHIDNYDVDEQTDQAQALIGYLPENLPVYPEMIVVDYLNYCAELRGLQDAEAATAVREVIAKTALEEKSLHPIATLSRGYKQRVGVAQALLHKPKVLILDEPTNGLDPHQTHQMRTLIRNLAGEATVILSTHIMQEVDALCDRVLIVDHGSLAIDSTLEDLRRCDTLQLDTDAKPETLKSILTDLPTSTDYNIVSSGDTYRYHLPIAESADVKAICADLATQLVNGGNKLYSLNPLYRDLETVFRDIATQRHLQNQEVSNAA